LTSEVANRPFARLPEPIREDTPIAISRSLFLATTLLISQLGELKEEGEDLEGLRDAECPMTAAPLSAVAIERR
jgi:hypothetical protein